jgi:hypothetical protein
MGNPSPRFQSKQVTKREAIGAFCTDISNSTERIERFQELALKHHKAYLEAAGKYFVQKIPKLEREDYVSGDLWVPGDALWGVFYPQPGKTFADSISSSLWRAICSFAYGLSVANYSRPKQLDPLSIRGVFLAGRVIRETLFDDRVRLYNGRALNTCGRLEGHVDPNKVVAGFVIPRETGEEDLSLQAVARSPEVYVSGPESLESHLRSCRQPRRSGCSIHLKAVLKNDRKLLRFRGWKKRKELRGLLDSSVLTTEITLTPKAEPGFELVYDSIDKWDRSASVELVPNQTESQWDLHDLLRDDSGPFRFVRHLYRRDELIVTVPSDASKSFVLQSQRRTDRPRILKNQGTHRVDFGEHSSCFLPTNVHSDSGGRNVLIQAYRKRGVRTLCFSLVSDDLLSQYDEYADFLDSGSPAREISFQKK